MRSFETRLTRYMDAGFPLLYVDTFEEEPLIDIDEVKRNIAEIEAELAEVQAQMTKYMKELGL